ncbi:MAG: DNA-processing protein DprA [Bacteroidales bacterium]|nr:DNA-processing protein DprA [Bacteroidales bacterium]
MEKFEEKACLCALNRIFGFSPKTGLALISHTGSAADVFRLGSRELEELLGPSSRYKGEITWKAVEEASDELARLESRGIGFTGWTEEEYPSLLHECEDAPVGLYVRSRTPMDELWKPCRRIAVVGTRDITPYGREWCVRTVAGLSRSKEKPVIVSGLALGTDFCAHKAALESGLATIGVMATGPETVYPHRHREFAERLCETPGCALVTDYPPGTAPLAVHFLRRNRIIAGLSDSTILIESKIKGGGMMTCRLAFSYSRDVYALPGRADDLRSQGCNSLIRSKIAEPLTSIEDLTESLGLNRVGAKGRRSVRETLISEYGSRLSPEKAELAINILTRIKEERGITIEELAEHTGMSYSMTANITAMLETDGFISIDLLQRCFIMIEKFR